MEILSRLWAGYNVFGYISAAVIFVYLLFFTKRKGLGFFKRIFNAFAEAFAWDPFTKPKLEEDDEIVPRKRRKRKPGEITDSFD